MVCPLPLRICAYDSSEFAIDHKFAVKVLESLSQLMTIFLVNDFAWDGSASLVTTADGSPETTAGAEVCLTLVSPATAWGWKRPAAPNNSAAK
jgi:hypothetical protein